MFDVVLLLRLLRLLRDQHVRVQLLVVVGGGQLTLLSDMPTQLFNLLPDVFSFAHRFPFEPDQLVRQTGTFQQQVVARGRRRGGFSPRTVRLVCGCGRAGRRRRTVDALCPPARLGAVRASWSCRRCVGRIPNRDVQNRPWFRPTGHASRRSLWPTKRSAVRVSVRPDDDAVRPDADVVWRRSVRRLERGAVRPDDARSSRFPSADVWYGRACRGAVDSLHIRRRPTAATPTTPNSSTGGRRHLWVEFQCRRRLFVLPISTASSSPFQLGLPENDNRRRCCQKRRNFHKTC
ncbi:conserved hypothetical protein [Trichinella spiralis]|uniref:hypothetical protein n=1 Tax=Trichinella spiralis TaxID=6334 RepID=UPI0001EFC09B|nr:conserved hypothetical protein [Trichinella spiralis]